MVVLSYRQRESAASAVSKRRRSLFADENEAKVEPIRVTRLQLAPCNPRSINEKRFQSLDAVAEHWK
jgi:hypothetical protein